MDPNLDVNLPIPPRRQFPFKYFLLFTIITVLIIILVLVINYLQLKKKTNATLPPQTTSTPVSETKRPNMQLAVEGIVFETKPDYLWVKEPSGQLTQIFIDKLPSVTIQTLSLLKGSKQSTSAAVVAGKILSNKQADYNHIKEDDLVKILVKDQDKNLWAEEITIIKLK